MHDTDIRPGASEELGKLTITPSATNRAPCPRSIKMAASKRTYTYKVVADCEIRADVYGMEDDLLRPVIIWSHGGALIMGDRGDIPDEQLDM